MNQSTLPSTALLTLIPTRSRRRALERATGQFSLVPCLSGNLYSTRENTTTILTQRTRGQPGEEANDHGFTFAHARRRSNSSTHSRKDFKTKFEIVEREPVFEDMPFEEEEAEHHHHLEKQTTGSSSSDDQSALEEEHN